MVDAILQLANSLQLTETHHMLKSSGMSPQKIFIASNTGTIKVLNQKQEAKDVLLYQSLGPWWEI